MNRFARGCSSSRSLRTVTSRAYSSITTTTPTTPLAPLSANFSPLHTSLTSLQKHASPYVNLPRLQLALRGLEQSDKTTRIAIIGLQGSSRARQLTKLFLADPLSNEEDWERTLKQSDKPLLLRIGSNVSHNRLVDEIAVSPPHLRDKKLELLVYNTNKIDNVLTPTIEIPTSATRFTPITTPVHKALVVAEGYEAAAVLLNSKHPDGVLNAPGHPEFPYPVVDLDLAENGVRAFRQSANNALVYEKGWNESGIRKLVEWLKQDADLNELVRSILDDAESKIQAAKELQKPLLSEEQVKTLLSNVRVWSERAHTELRDQLDIAFEGSRWRKLGWWKLFWRVDDVTMISVDILSNRFLVDAEKELIYLTGKIIGSGLPANDFEEAPTIDRTPHEGYKSAAVLSDLVDKPEDTEVAPFKLHVWPIDLHVIRTMLAVESVPALQALAQRLVIQTASTSSLVSALGGLLYLSDLSGLYGAGAVAALGIVWSLKRLQRKWEAAREYWEGEVREEGRKVIRTVEGRVTAILHMPTQRLGDLEEAEEAVERVREALDAEKVDIKA